MIGQSVHAVGRPALWQAALSLIAITLFAIGASMQLWHLAFLSALPFSFSIVGWMRRTKSCDLSIEADGIRPLGEELIRFDEMDRLLINRKMPSQISAQGKGKIEIHYGNKTFHIPSRLSVDFQEFVDFLSGRIIQRAATIPDTLQAYYEDMCHRFGTEMVHVFDAPSLNENDRKRSKGAARLFCFAFSLCGVLWILAGALTFNLDYVVWIALGVVMLILGLLSLGIRGVSKSAVKGHSGIIASPMGIALKQGDLQGAMPWDQVTTCKWVAQNRVLRIEVQGAQIDVLDIYDRSIRDLEQIVVHAIQADRI